MTVSQKRGAELALIAVTLMGSIGATGYLTMAVLGWSEDAAGPFLLAVNLPLAAFLCWLYGRRRARDPYEPRPATIEQPAFAQQPAWTADPGGLACCPHLRELEGLIRQRGIQVVSNAKNTARADCQVDEPAVRRMLRIDQCVRYEEYHDHKDADAHFYCSRCKFRLFTRHPFTRGETFP